MNRIYIVVFTQIAFISFLTSCNDAINEKSSYDVTYDTLIASSVRKDSKSINGEIEESEIQCSNLIDRFEEYLNKYQEESVKLNEELDATTAMRQASFYQATRSAMESLDRGGQKDLGLVCWQRYLALKKEFILLCAQNGERPEATRWDLDELEQQIIKTDYEQ